MYIVFPKFRAFRGFGVNNAEITKISSEQNKISLTLFQISSEIKKINSELFVPIPWANFCIPKNSENIDE